MSRVNSAEVRSEASDALYANLALTALPHRDIPKPNDSDTWQQIRDGIHFEFFSAHYANGEPIGVPFGPTARLILIHQLTEAIRTQNRKVSLGPSANQWIRNMKRDAIGGRTYRQFSNQALRLGTCKVRVSRGCDKSSGRSVVESWLVPSDTGLLDYFANEHGLIDPDPWYAGERRKRCASGTVNKQFLDCFGQNLVKIYRSDLLSIANNSRAIDLYIWLRATESAIRESTIIPWSALAILFKGNCRHEWHFRSALIQSLMRVAPLIPSLRIEQKGDGWIVHPSADKSATVNGHLKHCAIPREVAVIRG